MIWIREIKHGIAQYNEELFIFAHEYTCERMILSLDDYALSRPLPELGLGRPKLLGVTTHYQGSVLALFFLLLTQCIYSFPSTYSG
jgi:hypothetical protein